MAGIFNTEGHGEKEGLVRLVHFGKNVIQHCKKQPFCSCSAKVTATREGADRAIWTM